MDLIKLLFKKIGASKILSFILLIALQIAVYILIFNFLLAKVPMFFSIFTFISIGIILYVINSNSNSNYKLLWIMLLLVFQGIGTITFIYMHTDSLYKAMKSRYKKIKRGVSSHFDNDEKNISDLGNDVGIFNTLKYDSGYPAYKNTESTYLKTGEEYYNELINELKKAKKYILMEYFIISNDFMWQSILNILIKKVSEGVEVKLIYDGFGSLLTLPSKYDEYLNSQGIDTLVFSKVRPLLAIHQNNRDHRKLTVIDGHVAFTGGINIADEYINKIERFGYWKDNGIKITGHAVESFTLMFFELWQLYKKDYFVPNKYLINYKNLETNGLVAPYSECPFESDNTCEDVYLNIINSSNKYLYITTPYLMLDDVLEVALSNAVKRGVDVRIILPSIPDKKYAYAIACSNYKKLIKKGIKIYEYLPGFIHAKTFLSDDKWGTIGSVNLDYRSLYLHFECGVLLYKVDSLNDIKNDINSILSESKEITIENIKKIPLRLKLEGHILQVFAPLM